MTQVKFAVVVGSDVAGTIIFDANSNIEAVQRFIAAYRSNPVIIETDNQEVEFGWTWNGNTFNPPGA